MSYICYGGTIKNENNVLSCEKAIDTYAFLRDLSKDRSFFVVFNVAFRETIWVSLAGFIDSIGLDMYLRLLNEAIRLVMKQTFFV